MALRSPCRRCGRLTFKPCPCAGRTTTQRGYGAPWQALSKRVIVRDGGVCQLRLAGCTFVATTADHRVPKARGGTDHQSNLQAACRSCNSSKRDR